MAGHRWVLGAALLLAACSRHGQESVATTQQTLPGTLSITLSAPHGVSPTAPVIECSSSLALASRTSVTGTVVALGSSSPSFSAAHDVGVTGDAWSRSLASLASAVQITGTLHASQVQTAAGDSIGSTDAAPVIDPTSNLTWSIAYPTGTGSDVALSGGATQSLSPGLYGTVSTAAGANLQLSAGTYYLTGLQLARGSTVTLDPGNGAVIVYVTTSLKLDAAVSSPAGPAASFFVGYFGADAIGLGISGAPFYGDVVAPSTSITFHPASSPHSGFFAATDMTLTASTVVEYAKPTALVAASTPNAICVEPAGTGQYIALFGYNNATGAIKHVPVGPKNLMSPGALGQGQLEDYLAIDSPGAFSTKFDGSPLTWTLAGGTAIASAQSPTCSATPCNPACRHGEQCVNAVCVTECGDGLCAGDESCNTCPADCACAAGQVCIRNSCATPVKCGIEWQCGSGMSFGVAVDCGACPGPKTCVNHVCQ